MSRVACFQFDVRTGDLDHNLAEVEAAVPRAAEEGVQLLVLPEMWPTSFAPRSDATKDAATERALECLRELSAEYSICLVGSAYGPGEKPTNQLHAFEDGERILSFDKVHLFTPTAEGESFRAGEDPAPLVETRFGRLAGVVCYDLRFPEVLRVPFRGGMDVLAVCAQWPVPRLEHWRQLLIARAIENPEALVHRVRTYLRL